MARVSRSSSEWSWSGWPEPSARWSASWPPDLLRHLLPHAIAHLVVQASFDMGSAIISAAGLSFIGFGAQPPTPEWGVMISEGRNFISTQLWLSLFPGLAILFAVGAFNLLGDGLRDILDPRLRPVR